MIAQMKRAHGANPCNDRAQLHAAHTGKTRGHHDIRLPDTRVNARVARKFVVSECGYRRSRLYKTQNAVCNCNEINIWPSVACSAAEFMKETNVCWNQSCGKSACSRRPRKWWR